MFLLITEMIEGNNSVGRQVLAHTQLSDLIIINILQLLTVQNDQHRRQFHNIRMIAKALIGFAYSLNFIMLKKGKQAQEQSLEISFANQHPQNRKNDERLEAEIYRVHAIEKHRAALRSWTLNQQNLCTFLANYDLFPQNGLSIEMLLNSSKLKLVKSEGKIYFGQVQQKQRHGWGIQIQKSGSVYEGQFFGNQKKGQGVEVYNNGNLYVGNFFNNKKHGKGIFYWFNLTTQHSKCPNNIEYYTGEWWGGLPDGQGMHSKACGDIYTGSFKNGLKHGQGEESYINGDHYQGQYVNGLPEGYGEYLWSDGSQYKGDFKQGLRSGYGVWKASNSRLECYQGHYISDKKMGYGVYTWDNGWSYRGNFENDYRNGYGELFDSQNIMTYQGQWLNGNQIDRENARLQLQDEDDPEQKYYQSTRQFSNSNLRTPQRSRKWSEAFRISSKERYQSAQAYRQPQRQQVEYAANSHNGYQNLCKRPEPYEAYSKELTKKGIRIRNGQIGTQITRPLAPGPEAISRRNRSSHRF